MDIQPKDLKVTHIYNITFFDNFRKTTTMKHDYVYVYKRDNEQIYLKNLKGDEKFWSTWVNTKLESDEYLIEYVGQKDEYPEYFL